ncbi:hypothetical protein [Nocardia sp. NPDC051463]|uniref:hypothetical protein n=1 Tax=Nocardia sp. NPDC051463 TaxID=3154845 RepID=UPI00344F186A
MMPAAIDVRAEVDLAEIILRSIFVYLGIPEQPDSFWEDMAAELTAEFGEYAAMYLNAFAVMADWTQPTIEES